jgi:hypothetical protein
MIPPWHGIRLDTRRTIGFPGRMSALPPLAEEDHVCPDCPLSFPELTVERALEIIGGLPAKYRETVSGIPEDARRKRPKQGVWSVAEYACHVRDVYMNFTIRLYRTRTEDRPAVEPMLNDLRAARFRYNDSDLTAVLDELAAYAAGFAEEAARTKDWDRTATRLQHEMRTARWLVRQATHEGTHHLLDIERVARSVLPKPGK